MKPSSLLLKPLFFLAFALLFFVLKAQEFAPIGATWHYSYSYFGAEGYLNLQVTGDTSINGNKYHKIDKHYWYYYYPTASYSDYSGKPIFVRSSNDSVFAYQIDKDILLYRFNVQVGDSWPTRGEMEQITCPELSTITVTAVGYESINGRSVKYIETSFTENQSWRYYERINQVMGPLDYLFATPRWSCNSDPDEASGLRCYSDNFLGSVKLSNGPCDYITGINNNDGPTSIGVFPNPSSDIVNITGDVKEIQVFTTEGKLILTENTGANQLDISFLPSGTYILSMKMGTGYVSHQLLTKK